MSLFTTIVDPTGVLQNLGSRLPDLNPDEGEATPIPRWVKIIAVGVLGLVLWRIMRRKAAK